MYLTVCKKRKKEKGYANLGYKPLTASKHSSFEFQNQKFKFNCETNT